MGRISGVNSVISRFQFYNSAIKRLPCWDLTRHVRKFQFYNSAIKSWYFSLVADWCSYFNSTIVRLKESGIKQRNKRVILFQFYNSAIKSVLAYNVVLGLLTFQFYNSAIKSPVRCVNAPAASGISILQ